MTITLICPSRSRPERMRRMWDSARQTAHAPDKLTLRLGINGEEVQVYRSFADGSSHIYAVYDWGIVHTANRIAQDVMLDTRDAILMIAPDDVIFATPHWDKAMLDHYAALENKAHVYCLRDSRDENGTPHPAMTREYVNLMGYFFPPLFLHWYVDTWTAEIARANGIFTHLKDYLLKHEKPSDQGMYDSTYARVRSRGWKDRDQYVHETCRHVLEGEKDRLRILMQQAAGTREHVA